MSKTLARPSHVIPPKYKLIYSRKMTVGRRALGAAQLQLRSIQVLHVIFRGRPAGATRTDRYRKKREGGRTNIVV